ncbi:MAG: rhombosortase [Pseudomonadota bacterium]
MLGTHLPRITLILCALALCLQFLPQAFQSLLYFDRAQLLGSPAASLSLITAHWIHADWSHLVWNLAALGVLGAILEQQSARLLVSAVITGTIGVNALLLSPMATIDQYCGLSGLLNTLLGVALFEAWRRTRAPGVAFIACLCLCKLGVELWWQQSLLTDFSWPPYVPAHLAGLLATPLALVWAYPGNFFDRIKVWKTAI